VESITPIPASLKALVWCSLTTALSLSVSLSPIKSNSIALYSAPRDQVSSCLEKRWEHRIKQCAARTGHLGENRSCSSPTCQSTPKRKTNLARRLREAECMHPCLEFLLALKKLPRFRILRKGLFAPQGRHVDRKAEPGSPRLSDCPFSVPTSLARVRSGPLHFQRLQKAITSLCRLLFFLRHSSLVSFRGFVCISS
jgi:hypothetical protein